MVGIEYLTNLGQIPEKAYFLFAPPKIQGSLMEAQPGFGLVLASLSNDQVQLAIVDSASVLRAAGAYNMWNKVGAIGKLRKV